MIFQLFAILKKNIKRLSRSKTSSLVILLGPLILILIIGLAFNTTGIRGITIGVYSNGSDDFSNTLLEKFSGTDFKAVEELTEEVCIENVRSGKNHVCIVDIEYMQQHHQDLDNRT